MGRGELPDKARWFDGSNASSFHLAAERGGIGRARARDRSTREKWRYGWRLLPAHIRRLHHSRLAARRFPAMPTC